jgi:UDP-N-acetyl-D-glucosamine dehydrogenase
MTVNLAIEQLRTRISSRSATVGVCGMGYVGLPLATSAAKAGFTLIGFDIDENKVKALNGGLSYIDGVSNEDLDRLRQSNKFRASGDFSELSLCDVIAVCVPTPLTRHREPDLSYVEQTAETIRAHIRDGQLIVIESTTYPGTTEEVVKPILQKSGRESGINFLLGYSPEREDPGNAEFRTRTIPKITAGDGDLASELICLFYRSFVERVIPVSTMKAAEAVKLTENVFRAVNVALVNELKIIYSAMGIDVWEVIEAAKTKPFGYMAFYPGPGLGGHCIPIDPFYLTWKSREFELPTRFIELAGEINLSMPQYVIDKLAIALDSKQSISLGSARILIIGVAYKKNVADIRESPSLKLIEILHRRGTHVDYHDPLVPTITASREHAALAGLQSVELRPDTVASYNAAVIAADHDSVDYALLSKHARLIVDTRNVMSRKGLTNKNVVPA